MFGLPDGVSACLFDMVGVVTKTATLHAAAEVLHVPAAHAVVFEDTQAGVAAGHAGHFVLVVGVDRIGQAAELREHGADIVVKDLSELLDRDGGTR
jgi:beta-phosphoglucomutase-like phosphatase (HAD superfamily)